MDDELKSSEVKNAGAFYLLGCCAGLEGAAVICAAAGADLRYPPEVRAMSRVLARQLRKLKEETGDARESLVEVLVRREIITTDPKQAAECCGIERDADGFCSYRPDHPIYVGPRAI